jgi:ABC-type transport system substrate-binding protein
MRSRRLLPALFLTATVLAAAMPPSAEAQTPKRGGTLRVSYGNDIANLDFHTAPGYEMMSGAVSSTSRRTASSSPTRRIRGRSRRTTCSTRSR